MQQLPPGIIVDNGSSACKVGFAGEKAPKVVLTYTVRKRQTNIIDSDIAQSKKNVLTSKFPIERGVIKNMDEMEKVWAYAFKTELNVDPKNHPVLLTEICKNPEGTRQEMLKIMFEKFQTPAVYLGNQATLSLFAAGGLNSGVVIDVGDGVTEIVPIEEGYPIYPDAVNLPIGGRDLTDFVMKDMAKDGYTTPERVVVQDIKEKMCYVSQDFQKEAVRPKPNGRKNTYKLPDGQVVSPDERNFTSPEALFQPSILGMDFAGIHENAYKTICTLVPNNQYIFENILLAGGSTMFPGMVDRMEKEIGRLASKQIKIVERPDRKYSAWLGGSMLASIKPFEGMWISKQGYEEFGPVISYKKCF